MAEHTATIVWQRADAPFTDNNYSREHHWRFDGGADIPASSSPHVVPVPRSNPAFVDPEEAFVAALSSCHMLWFLFIAAKRGFVVDSYTDDAVGVMAQNTDGKLAMTLVTLRPMIVFAGATQPTEADIDQMHEAAHDSCYIANSVKTDVVVAPAR